MIGAVFRFMGMLPAVLGTVGAIVAIVEAVGQVAEATGEQKRAAAVERLREAIGELGIPWPEQLLGPLVDLVVWGLNTVTRKGWSENVEEHVAASLEAAGVDSPAGRTPDEIEASVREEFQRLEAKNAGVAGRQGGGGDDTPSE